MLGRRVDCALGMRWGALALGATLFVLALPAQASATSPLVTSLYTGAVKKHGVKIALSDDGGLVTVGIAKCAGPCRLVVMKGLSGRNETRRAIAAARSDLSRSANYDEGDFFSFGAGVAYRIKQNLSWARMHGRFARQHVSINVDMTFHATTAASTIPVGKGCTGRPGTKRKGVLRGTLRFTPGLLGTLTVRSFSATLEIPVRESCPPPPPPHHVLHLVTAFTDQGLGEFDVTRLKKGGVFEDAAVTQGGPGFSWFFIYFLNSVRPLPNADYRYAPNLSSGTITGGGPFHGTAKYTGTPKGTHCSHGKLGGDLTARFATLGTVKLLPHGTVKARQCEQ